MTNLINTSIFENTNFILNLSWREVEKVPFLSEQTAYFDETGYEIINKYGNPFIFNAYYTNELYFVDSKFDPSTIVKKLETIEGGSTKIYGNAFLFEVALENKNIYHTIHGKEIEFKCVKKESTNDEKTVILYLVPAKKSDIFSFYSEENQKLAETMEMQVQKLNAEKKIKIMKTIQKKKYDILPFLQKLFGGKALKKRYDL